jgi:Cu-Zn family superoxide dismutase
MKTLLTIIISSLCLVSCSDDKNTTPTDTVLAMSSGAWTVYTLTPAGTANPAANIAGTAKAVKDGAGMRIDLDYTGLPPNMAFGSHIHKLDCATNMAGGHYQNMPVPTDAGNDPMYANATNEVWMDFTADTAGKVKKSINSAFVPRAGEAKAIIVHAMSTATGGVAGAKLACLNMPF